MIARRFVRFLLGWGLLISGSWTQAAADTLSFTVSNASLTISGGDVIFQGTVANNSGADLNASDLFFNFFGYDPLAVTPTQNLGVLIDFLIPNGTTSGTVDLFDVLLGSVPNGANFQLQVQLEDINSDLSAIQSVTVSTPAASPVPEPPTVLLTGIALGGILLLRRSSRTARSC